MAYLILGNVVLSYGMETAFFRFINKNSAQKKQVQSTVLTSLLVTTTLFFGLGMVFSEPLARHLDFKEHYVVYALCILALDALVILPFAWFRANERPMRYAVIKIGNVLLNLGGNLFFFLVLPELAATSGGIWSTIATTDTILYVFIANLIASGLTLVVVIPIYFKIKLGFHPTIWKAMFRYALPVLVAGIAFSINEAFDKILLKYLLPPTIADVQVGVYAACYKLGVFMTLFSTAFRLGIEPFFFNHAQDANAKITYATITKYFVIFGSCIVLVVIVFIDVLKRILVPDPDFWVALDSVPIILMANLCLGIYHNLSVWYKVTDRTAYGAFISIIGALLTIVLNFILIPSYSYLGSAYTTLAAYATMMVLSYFFGRKIYPIPYDIKRILGYLAMATVFSVLSFYLFKGNYYFSMPLLGIFFFILYKNEGQELKQLLGR